MSGEDFVIGQPVYGQNACGTAFAFVPSGSTWRSKEQLVNHVCTGSDIFGWSVAASGTTAVIGAPGTNKNAGAFYVRTIP
jgi:FG-GAP repeat